MQLDIFLDKYDASQVDLLEDFCQYVAHSLEISDQYYALISDDVQENESAMGFMIKTSWKSFDIFIKAGLNKFDMLETIAHELAHIKDSPKLTYRENDALAEIKARQLAARYLEITNE